MAGKRTLTLEILGNAAGAIGAFKKAEGAGKKFSDGLTSIGKTVGLGLGAASVGAVAFGKTALDSAVEAQKQQAKISTIVKNTGNAANISAKGIDNLAGSMMLKTGIDDEAIKQSMSYLLVTKQVRNEQGKGNNIFDRASMAALDLGKAFGSSDSAAKALGKALSDPAKGLTALKRAGVTFTDDQRKQIQSMKESGNTLGAQKMILDAVEGRVGGLAEKSATAGDKMKVAFGEVQEKIGGALLPIAEKLSSWVTEKLIPGIEGFVKTNGPAIKKIFADIADRVRPVAHWLGENLPKAFHKLGDFAKKNKPAVAAFIGVLVAATAIAGIAALVAAFNPVTLAIVGIGVAAAALVAGIVYMYDHFKWFKTIVDAVGQAFKLEFQIMWEIAKWFFNTISDGVKAFIDLFKGWWSIFGDDIKAIWNGIWEYFTGVFDLFKDIFTGKWSKIGEDIQKILGGLGGIIGGIFSGIFDGAMAALQVGWNLFARGVNILIRQIQRIPGFGWVPLLPMWEDQPRNTGGTGGTRRAFATGGIVTGPTNALIGEAGPEAVIPLSRAGSFGLGGNSTVNINVQVSPLSNPAEVGQAVVGALKAYERRSGPLPLRVA